MTIGEKIKRCRKENKLSQAKLAELSGRSKSSIEKYECGAITPSLEAIKSIAKALNVKLEYLIDLNASISSQIDTKETIKEEIRNNLDIDNLAIKKELHKHFEGKELEQIYHGILVRECELIQNKCNQEIEAYKREVEFYKERFKLEEEYRKKLQETLDKIFETNNKIISERS